MMKTTLSMLAAVLFLSLVPPAFAAENSQNYFSALPDVPLMAGMNEVEDQTFVFDKAEGRVIETAGFLSAAYPNDPRKYYSEVLGHLGWKPLKSGVFARNNEQLIVNVEKVGKGVVVKFQLSPLSR